MVPSRRFLAAPRRRDQSRGCRRLTCSLFLCTTLPKDVDTQLAEFTDKIALLERSGGSSLGRGSSTRSRLFGAAGAKSLRSLSVKMKSLRALGFGGARSSSSVSPEGAVVDGGIGCGVGCAEGCAAFVQESFGLKASIAVMLGLLLALCAAVLIEVGSYGDPMARTIGGLVGCSGAVVCGVGAVAVMRPRRWTVNALVSCMPLVLGTAAMYLYASLTEAVKYDALCGLSLSGLAYGEQPGDDSQCSVRASAAQARCVYAGAIVILATLVWTLASELKDCMVLTPDFMSQMAQQQQELARRRAERDQGDAFVPPAQRAAPNRPEGKFAALVAP